MYVCMLPGNAGKCDQTKGAKPLNERSAIVWAYKFMHCQQTADRQRQQQKRKQQRAKETTAAGSAKFNFTLYAALLFGF